MTEFKESDICWKGRISHKTFYKVEQITICQTIGSNCPEFKKFYFSLAITVEYADNVWQILHYCLDNKSVCP